jgi:hypothetical protein
MVKACVPLLLDKSNIRGLATTDNNYNCITHYTVTVHIKFMEMGRGVRPTEDMWI